MASLMLNLRHELEQGLELNLRRELKEGLSFS